MKRKNAIVALIVLCAILFTIVSFPAIAEEEREILQSGDYKYAILDDGSIKITGYYGGTTELAIPESIDGRTVTSIGDEAFFWCDSLTNITIPDSVTSIGDDAFSFCNGLTSITIPASVTNMGSNPFLGCSNLIEIKVSPNQPVFATLDSVLFNKIERKLICYPRAFSFFAYSIPSGTQSIGASAFSCCDRLTSITIPDSVTSIGDKAFSSCDGLTEIMIPNSVTSIGDKAFSYCDSLTSITIPNSVTSIGLNPFVNWKKPIKIKMSPDQPVFATIDGVLFSKVERKLISYSCALSANKYSIPSGIQSIGDEAFSCCDSLTSVTIPDSVTSIGDYAFSSCDSLTSVTIPASVTSIGVFAFSFSPNLCLTVGRDSYAKQYAIDYGIQYTYPDAIDWLNG